MKSTLTLFALALMTISGGRAQQLFTNGAVGTGSTSQNGSTAPGGTQWSEVQSDAGNPYVANALTGFGTNGLVASEAADDFVVPAGQTWTVSSFRFLGYQPGAAAGCPFSGLTVRVWRGQPGHTKARVIFGDSTTNRLSGSSDAFTYRVFNSSYPLGSATPTGTTRKVWEVEATIAPGLVLPPGPYWISWSATATGTHAYYFVPVTTVGARTQAGANAQLHSTGIYGTYPWSPIIDSGIGAGATPVNIDMAFKVFGTSTPLAARVGQPAPDGLRLAASPVPATDAVHLTLDNLRGSAQLLLTDLHGRLVWAGQLPAGSTTATVPVATLAPGLYLLEARTATSWVQTRILKE